MKQKRRKNMYIIILTLVITVVGLSLAYASLNATLNVEFGDITQNALTWDVGFLVGNGTVEAKAAGTSDTGRSCGNASITSDKVTVGTTSLSKPDDRCTYELTIKNNGTIAAMLSTITPKNPSSTTCSTSNGAMMVCGNLTYRLTTDEDGNDLLTNNRLIPIEGELPIYLVVSYTGSGLNESNVVQSEAAFTLNYAQS